MWFFSYQTGVIKASIAFVIIFEFDTTVLALKKWSNKINYRHQLHSKLPWNLHNCFSFEKSW